MNRQIYQEASEWLVELRVGDIDAAARSRLDAWFRASPENLRAFLELSSIWEDASDKDIDRGHGTDELIARARAMSNVVSIDIVPRSMDDAVEGSAQQDCTESQDLSPLQTQIPSLPNGTCLGVGLADLDANAVQEREPISLVSPVASGGVDPDYAPPRAHRVRRLKIRHWAVAASIAFLAAAAILLYARFNETYSTGIGEQRTLRLADGSLIELNARSSIRVSLSAHERDVELLAGQALFTVAKDANRPFIVASGPTRVRAVGTQFDVYRKESGTTVTVVEGKVAVLPQNVGEAPAPADAPASDATAPTGSAVPGVSFPGSRAGILLSAGEQMTVTEQEVSGPKKADTHAATAWTQRELVFDGASLSDVASEFNRYNQKPLIVRDMALKDFHVTGVFSSTDPASLLRFLKAQKGIHVEETEAGIRISKQ